VSEDLLGGGLFDPEGVIDREAESELFETMLALGHDARVLTVSDKGFMGKSTLLKKFEYRCQWITPYFPVSLTDIDANRLDDQTPFGLVGKIRADISDLSFPKFDPARDAHAGQDFSFFAPATGTGIASASSVSGGVLAGRIGTVIQTPSATIAPATSATWTLDMDRRARERCVEAFFEDLRAICADQTVVVILDTFDNARLELQQWIVKVLLRHHIVDERFACDRLLVVLAGRELPNLNPALGRRLQSIGVLSSWDKEHIRSFLQKQGVDPSDVAIDFVQELLADGKNLLSALSVARELRRITT